jgi:acyl-CoA dehydrogenase
MKEMGLFGLSIPEEYGGIGLSMSQECRVAYEIGHTSLAFRSVFGTNVGIGSQGILMDGTEAQKQEILPRVATGELIMSFALTEPDAGSDSGGGQDARRARRRRLHPERQQALHHERTARRAPSR